MYIKDLQKLTHINLNDQLIIQQSDYTKYIQYQDFINNKELGINSNIDIKNRYSDIINVSSIINVVSNDYIKLDTKIKQVQQYIDDVKPIDISSLSDNLSNVISTTYNLVCNGINSITDNLISIEDQIQYLSATNNNKISEYLDTENNISIDICYNMSVELLNLSAKATGGNIKQVKITISSELDEENIEIPISVYEIYDTEQTGENYLNEITKKQNTINVEVSQIQSDYNVLTTNFNTLLNRFNNILVK